MDHPLSLGNSDLVEPQGDFAIYQHNGRFAVIRISQSEREACRIQGFTCYTLREAQALLAQLQGR